MNLIGYIRTPAGLKALVVRVVENDPEPGPARREFVEIPIKDFKNEPDGIRTRLTESWENLADKRLLNEHTLFHIMVVLLETIPVFVGWKTTARPDAGTQKPFQPTAAHPRAYKGTKDRLPKPKIQTLEHIQDHLCYPQGLRDVLKTLAPYWPNALDLLAKAGYRAEALESIDPGTADLYMAYYHPDRGKETDEKLPAPFVKYILPSLRGSARPVVTEFLSLYWDLSLARKKGLLPEVVALICLKSDKNTLKWLKILTAQSLNRRPVFIRLLMETDMYQIAPPADFKQNMLRFEQAVLKRNYAHYLEYLFKAIQKGINFDYLFAGFLLGQKYDPNFYLDRPNHNCTDFSLALMEKIHARLK